MQTMTIPAALEGVRERVVAASAARMLALEIGDTLRAQAAAVRLTIWLRIAAKAHERAIGGES